MVKDKLDLILPFVRKPERYLGGEIHAIRKDHKNVKARLALAFPDTYEIGACNTGLSMLYHIVNSDPLFLAERVYMVDFDMKDAMTRERIPLYGLESFTPLKEFDVIGFTLQYELSYPNIPAMLMLSGIEPMSKDRMSEDPVIIAGGPLTINPEPLKEIIDAFVIGDGEEAIIACLHAVAENKTRAEKIEALSKIPGVYVPIYPPLNFKPAKVATLKKEYYPKKPLVPLIEPIQNRLAIEVMRGCSHGCRYCSAGYFYRPIRERDPLDVIDQLHNGVGKEGWREVSILSLSTADYSGLRQVLVGSRELTGRNKAHLSLPSTRIDRVTADIFEGLGISRRTGITFAPEAGSERLRRVINKGLTDDEIVDNIKLALDKGFSVIKLYFMIGLPTEEESDIDAIINLLSRIQPLFRGQGRKSLNVSVAPFCPKPGTPFEREPLLAVDIVRARSLRIKAALYGKFVEFHWGGGETAVIETIFARGGGELSQLLISAAKEGLVLQSWAEHFNLMAWNKLFNDNNILPECYTNRFKQDRKLPWDFLVPKIRQQFLSDEYAKALKAEITADCRAQCLSNCGTCNSDIKNLIVNKIDSEVINEPPVFVNKKNVPPISEKYGYLLFYEKNINGRFIPYHDMAWLIERALLIAGASLSYSEGFSPQPQMSFTYPLTLGFTGLREPCRIILDERSSPDLLDRANEQLPKGLRLLEFGPSQDRRALEKVIFSAEYAITLGERINTIKPILDRFIDTNEFIADIESKSGIKKINIRPLLLNSEIRGGSLFLRLSLGARGMLRVQDLLNKAFQIEREEILRLPICRTGFIDESERML